MKIRISSLFMRTDLQILVASIIFLLICLPFFSSLPMSESVYFWNEIETFKNLVANTWHPPLYLFFLYAFAKIFSGHYIAGYILGIFCVLVTVFIMYIVWKDYNKDISAYGLIFFLLIINFLFLPVIIHGSFIFDIDNTILSPLLLLIYFTHLKFIKHGKKKLLFVYFFLLNLAFWAKMTTPLILMSAIGFYHLIIKDYNFLFKKLVPLYIFSVLFFYLSYGVLYTEYVLNGFGSFQFSASKALGLLKGQNTFDLSLKKFLFSISSSLGALVVWSSPLLIILFLYNINKIDLIKKFFFELRNRERSYETIAVIFIFFILLNYSLVLKIQSSAGFPKYHYSLFPFSFLIIGFSLLKESCQTELKLKIIDRNFFCNINIKTFLIIFGFGIAWYLFFLDDFLYQFYTLGRDRKIFLLLKDFVKLLAILLFPFFISLIYLKKKGSKDTKVNPDQEKMLIPVLLLIFLFISNLVGALARTKADYSTNYHYGIKKTSEVLSFANKLPLTESVYLPYAGLFIKPGFDYPHSVYGRIMDSDPFKPTTSYVIITDYLLYSNNYFFKSSYIEKKYERIKTIGSYGIWKKKSASNE